MLLTGIIGNAVVHPRQQQQASDVGTSTPHQSLDSSSSLSDWQAASFLTLPCFEDAEPKGHGAIVHGRVRIPHSNRSATLFSNWDDYGAVIGSYLEHAEGWLGDVAKWALDGAFAAHRMRKLFEQRSGSLAPFVSRLDLPAGSTVAVFGDLHGALHSLIRSLGSLVDKGYLTPQLTVADGHKQDFFMMFLGDYVDRGHYGAETLALLLTLRARNPGNVFLSRGNHEDENMNTWGSGAFTHEIQRKFGPSAPERGVPVRYRSSGRPNEIERDEVRRLSVYRVYDTLPSAIFLGVKGPSPSSSTEGDHGKPFRPSYLQCCHGGIEVGFDPRHLLTHGHGRCRQVEDAAAVNSDEHATTRGIECSRPTASDGSQPSPYELPSSGAEVRYALLHGYARGDWLAGLPPQLRSRLPHRVQAMMRNVGYAADVNAARQAVLDGSEGGASHAARGLSANSGAAAVEVGSDGEPVPLDSVDTPGSSADSHGLRDVLGVPCGWDDDDDVRGDHAQSDDEGGEGNDRDGSAWPAAPTHGDLGNGFMWSDFITHDPVTPLIYQRGRGLAFGLPVTDHLTSATPIVGFLRAHQHNNARESGPMLDAVIDGGGAFNNWNASGHVMTFLSGGHIPHLGFGRDAYGLLSLPTSHPSSWSMALCGQDVGSQFIVGVDSDPEEADADDGDSSFSSSGADLDGRGGGGKLGRQWRQRLATSHACNARRHFTCEAVNWRPPAPGRGR